jgi:hypothetical protein
VLSWIQRSDLIPIFGRANAIICYESTPQRLNDGIRHIVDYITLERAIISAMSPHPDLILHELGGYESQHSMTEKLLSPLS